MTENIKFVAHRGLAVSNPENSLSAFQAAIDNGAQFLELDVQLTNDLVPIVIHDEDLIRVANKEQNILQSSWQQLEDTTVGETNRLGEKFANEKLIRLQDFTQWLKTYPHVMVFVELKEESIAKFGKEQMLKQVVEVLAPVKDQCFLISFDASVLFYAKENVDYPLGFVLHKYDEEHQQVANKLQPEILICNYQKIPDEDNSLWVGNWSWFLYEICELAIAKKWQARGVEYIETMEIDKMIKAAGA